MSSSSRRRILAGAAALGATLCVAAPASAALTSPVASAFVVQADAIGTLVAVPATPASTFPPGGTVTTVGEHVGPFATGATLTATTAGSPTAGTSSASATVQNLGVNLGGLASLSLTGINSTCTATPSGAIGSGVIASGSFTALGLPVSLAANAPKNTGVTIPGVASIVLNQQTTDANGVLTVNALHITLLGGAGANVIIGQAKCGGAPMVQATPMVSAPIAAGLAAFAIPGGVVYLRRRNGKNLFDAS
jgi:hypothetical protein